MDPFRYRNACRQMYPKNDLHPTRHNDQMQSPNGKSTSLQMIATALCRLNHRYQQTNQNLEPRGLQESMQSPHKQYKSQMHALHLSHRNPKRSTQQKPM